jgi:hypothetical protein
MSDAGDRARLKAEALHLADRVNSDASPKEEIIALL